MTYYYLPSDGVTAGPASLPALVEIIAAGTVTLATLVVPAGGEDWTPLARVLRFFYPGENGEAAGPVAFSEIHRLHHTGVLGAEEYVIEEGGAEWKTVAAVLSAAGVEVLLPPPPPPPPPGQHRPHQVLVRPAAVRHIQKH
jgi:GYF domain 2